MYIVLVSYRRALEAKAAIYARLSGGDGVREEEDEGEGEEPRYMVDFTRKIWEEVNVYTCWSSKIVLACVHVHMYVLNITLLLDGTILPTV